MQSRCNGHEGTGTVKPAQVIGVCGACQQGADVDVEVLKIGVIRGATVLCVALCNDSI
jgi:hypothetical protein